jgi:hypothetical protein
MSALMLSVVPAVFAASVGSGVDVTIVTEDFPPIVWQCDHRVVYDDNTEPGRVAPQNGYCEHDERDLLASPVKCDTLTTKSACEDNKRCTWHSPAELVERINDYAFEGEQIKWKVLVMDKNGIDKVSDVYATVTPEEGDAQIEANCDRLSWTDNDRVLDSCNARILEEEITDFDPDTMAYYECTLTVETPESMYGEHDITVEALDLDGLTGTMAETEHWFLNPVIQLSVSDEGLTFDEGVRPGTSAYSNRLLVGNDADSGSGVMLDMFVSGTDFYDSSSSGAKCGDSNVLQLENFNYYATNGAYSTHDDDRSDDEGYVPIEYGIGFNDPNPFYDNNEIIQAQKVGPYYTANVLAPGAEMSLVFRLNLPEPCNGDFDTGEIFFWGEAI